MSGNVVQVVAAVIRRGGKVLLASRPANKPPCGWEFPGGKVEPGETLAEAVIRELAEELGVNVVPGECLESIRHGNILLHFVATELPEGEEPLPREGQECFYVELSPEPPEQLLPADRDFWRRLAER